MAKFFGIVGYAETKETSPGVWREEITERSYYGDVIRNNVRRSTPTDSTNDNLTIDNQISILADPYAIQNFHLMRYVEFMGTKWDISRIEVQDRRLTLTMGGVYTNG